MAQKKRRPEGGVSKINDFAAADQLALAAAALFFTI